MCSKKNIRVAITTLGCKTNQYDSAALIGRLDSSRFNVVPFSEQAEIYIVNSCTVTSLADRQSRQFAYQAKRRNPQAKVILTGCYATIAADELRKKPEIDFVVSRIDSQSIEDVILKIANGLAFDLGVINSDPQKTVPLFGNRSRPYLKIQDGCEAVCSYCIIPKSRGAVVSSPIDDVIARIKDTEAAGFKELVLTGIHVGQWGRDFPQNNGKPVFYDLLKAIEDSKPNLRIRISSLEPMELGDNIIKLISESQCFCPHLHIPLQSGSDVILKAMRRPYSTKHYRERIKQAANMLPNLGLGIDVIVGFPGEGETEFMETFEFLDSLPMTYLHVFPYSERPLTDAIKLDKKVTSKQKKQRARRLIELGKDHKNDFAESQLNRELQVLVEGKLDKDTGFYRGFSENYVETIIESDMELAGKIVTVKPNKMHGQFSLYAKYENNKEGS